MKNKIIEVTAAGENSATFYRWNFSKQLQQGILLFCKIANLQADEIAEYLERVGKKERTPIRYFARQIGIEEIEDFNEAGPPNKADYDKLQEFVIGVMEKTVKAEFVNTLMPNETNGSLENLRLHIEKFITFVQGLAYIIRIERAQAPNAKTISR